MPLIDTSTLDRKASGLTPSQTQQLYCGLDSCITLEVREALETQFGPPPPIYGFERAIQAPYLEIMQRGFRVDGIGRSRAAEGLRQRREQLQAMLDEFAVAVWDKPLNPRSPQQLLDFFYQKMRLPEQWISQKGERKLSTNREALEKLAQYLYARPFVNLILGIREIGKQLDVFETEIDQDGRMRTSYNIAGTECISGDSLVWTKGGLRTISEIYLTPHAVDIWNGSEFVTPIRKVKYENREGFEISLEGGYKIKCSSSHPLMTQRGFIEAKDIETSDRVQLNVGLTELFGQHALPRGGVLQQSSEDFCEFFGMILADGSLNANSEHYRCRLSNSDPTVQSRFQELVLSCFNTQATIYGEETTFSSKHICSWLKEFGFLADSGLGTANYKTIPEPLLRGKPNLLRALLRGLTLDSHITEKGLMFGTQSVKLREQLQQILLTLGIVSIKLQTGDAIKLNVPRRYCGRFISIIGFVQDSKLQQLSRLLNERSQWHEPIGFGRKTLVEVKEIKRWQGDVFDLTMPSSSPPQYVAQGMTVHNTGRPSSSENAFGTGGNLQNISPPLRYVFVADPGWKLAVIDLEQVEARDVGFFAGCLFNDWRYLDAAEAGDLHTNNAKLIWPELAWTGDQKKDKEIAGGIFYRDFSFRDMAKRGGHLSNYRGSAWMMARSLKIPIEIAEVFQARYCLGGKNIEPAFACIPRWWQWTAQQLQTTHLLETPFGRRRHFFGRPGDDTTLREAIAFLPQSTTADRMNLGLWRVWQKMPQVQLLAQTYDSITFQFRETESEDDIINRALELIRVELRSPSGRSYVVPGEAKVGWNWGYQVMQSDVDKAAANGKKVPRLNTEGLAKWKEGERDERVRATGLNRLG